MLIWVPENGPITTEHRQEPTLHGSRDSSFGMRQAGLWDQGRTRCVWCNRWDKDKRTDNLQNQSCCYKSCRRTLGKCIVLFLCLLYASSVERSYRPPHSPDRTITNPTQMVSIKLWDRHLAGRNNISPHNTVWDKIKLHKPSWYFSLHNMRTVTRWSVLGGIRESIIWDTLNTKQAGAHLIYRQWHFHVSQAELLRLCLFLDSTSIRLVSGCIFVLSLKSAASTSGLEKGFYT